MSELAAEIDDLLEKALEVAQHSGMTRLQALTHLMRRLYEIDAEREG